MQGPWTLTRRARIEEHDSLKWSGQLTKNWEISNIYEFSKETKPPPPPPPSPKKEKGKAVKKVFSMTYYRDEGGTKKKLLPNC